MDDETDSGRDARTGQGTLAVPGAGAGVSGPALTAALVRVMDVLPTELVLCTPAGSILHANHPARQRLDGGDRRKEIEEEIRYACVGLHLQMTEEAGEEADAVSQVERRVMLDGSEVRLRAVDLGTPRHGRGPATLVLLDPHDTLWDREMERVRLTRTEIRIARLVVRGKTNGEIARALSVSIHTVRHHVQHIYDKVGVRSRTQLREALRLP